MQKKCRFIKLPNSFLSKCSLDFLYNVYILVPAGFHTYKLLFKIDQVTKDSRFWNWDSDKCVMRILCRDLNCLQYVSVDNNNIVGYVSAGINLEDQTVMDLSLAKFTDKPCMTFYRDVLCFLSYLFECFYCYRIRFGVIVDSKHEKMYERFVRENGGRVVGTRKKSEVLPDGKYYDLKIYEITRKGYLHRKAA